MSFENSYDLAARIGLVPVPRDATYVVRQDKAIGLVDIRARAEQEGLRVVVHGNIAFLCRVRPGLLDVVDCWRIRRQATWRERARILLRRLTR